MNDTEVIKYSEKKSCHKHYVSHTRGKQKAALCSLGHLKSIIKNNMSSLTVELLV